MNLEAANAASHTAEAAHIAQTAASWKVLRRLGYRKSDAINFRVEWFTTDGNTDRSGLAAWRAMEATGKAYRAAERARLAFFVA
jgi:hypothetical protein